MRAAVNCFLLCRAVLLCGVLLVGSVAAVGDVIVLKSGQRVEGEVLKLQKDTLFVDVGVDVIRIPVDQIQERKGAEAPDPAKTAPVESLFLSTELPERTVKELVEAWDRDSSSIPVVTVSRITM